ncbi:MAG: hypothetical protein ACRBFS_10985 [Aureispira sp.]
MKKRACYWCWMLLLGNLLSSNLWSQLPVILEKAHAHNDYDKPWPALHTALNKGFRSIEVDVYPYQGQLKVAHWPFALGAAADLEALYLRPLDSLWKAESPWLSKSTPLILMIDIKRQGGIAQELLEKLCRRYAHLLCSFTKDSTHAAPVQVLLSGQYDWEHTQQQIPHYWQLDGRWHHLESSNQLVPRISQPYRGSFSWKGQGEQPEVERQLLDSLVQRAHAVGKTLRFWGVPNNTGLWKAFKRAGVDWIQVDDLKAYELFYNKKTLEKIRGKK